jgi:pyridoxine kinase
MKKVITIAGSDTSGGAGLQADLKTFQTLGVYGMSAVTCLVTMDPQNDWAHQVFPIEMGILCKQFETIFGGIGVDAVKTGMLATVGLIELVAEYLDKYKPPFVIVDPVLACKGEDEVMSTDVAHALRNVMVPRAYVLTPNLLEAGILSRKGKLTTIEDVKDAARILHEMGAKHVIIKGGTRLGTKNATDIYFDGTDFLLLENEKLEKPYNHGAGCTFASVITAEIAKGTPVVDAIKLANKFVYSGIKHGFELNRFCGCLDYTKFRKG